MPLSAFPRMRGKAGMWAPRDQVVLISGQMNGYWRSSMIGSMPKKSLSTDSAVQYAPSTQAWSFD
jgi:hypothetical protein